MEIRVLDHTADIEEVTNVLAVSTQIFYPTNTNETADEVLEPLDFHNPANNIDHWMDRLQNKCGEILHCYLPTTNEIVAFSFTCKHNYDVSVKDEDKSYHVWIAGCLPSYRRQGLMSQLFDMIYQRSARKGFQRLTVNTYPLRFKDMPNFLEKQGFIVYERIVQNKKQDGDAATTEIVDEKWCYHKLLTV